MKIFLYGIAIGFAVGIPIEIGLQVWELWKLKRAKQAAIAAAEAAAQDPPLHS